jgi:hypothetical protein
MFSFFKNLLMVNTAASKGTMMAKGHPTIKTSPVGASARKDSFQYQLDLLKMEIQSIGEIVARMDTMAQASKNWAIGLWTGSIAFTLSQPDLRKFLILSAVTPFLFWYLDASFRYLQRRSIYRSRKISEFLNSDRLARSFEQNQLFDFVVFDTTGAQYKETEEYRKFVSMKRTLNFSEVRDFYLVLILISIAMGIFFLLNT